MFSILPKFLNQLRKQLYLLKLKQPIWLIGDEVALREVLDNLISNAIHYSTSGNSIAISVEDNAKTIITKVSDHGIGIPPKSLGKLFNKYYRVASGLTSDSAGTGIGLFICKTIVEAHHGTISVSSKVGQGSTFSFELPAFDSARAAQLPLKKSSAERSKVG